MIMTHGRILSTFILRALSPTPRLRPRMPRPKNGMSGITMTMLLLNVYVPVSQVVEGFHILKKYGPWGIDVGLEWNS